MSYKTLFSGLFASITFLSGANALTQIEEALDSCGLPRGYWPTSHCFNDQTHHTCCLLGPKAREYADASGNPIGSAASRAFQHKNERSPNSTDLTPWCTCFGSLVCSYYASKFDDGTSIKFIFAPGGGSGGASAVFHVPPRRDCEASVREHLEVRAHGTPGISDHHSTAASVRGGVGCAELDVIANIRRLSDFTAAGEALSLGGMDKGGVCEGGICS